MSEQQQARKVYDAFLGGMLTVIWTLGPPNEGAREEVLRQLDHATGWDLIAYAKRNGEYRSSGLAEAARFVPPYNTRKVQP